MGRPPYIRRVVSFCCTLLAFIPTYALVTAQADSPPAPSTPTAALLINITPALVDSAFRLPNQFIVAGSDTLVLDSGRMLANGIEYTLNYRFGLLQFERNHVDSLLASTPDSHYVSIKYRYFPFSFQDSYFHRKLVIMEDPKGGDTVRVSRPRSAFNVDDIFGENLQKSGSIVRGFTVGSNRDFSLNSGLRLQLAGKIASDIDVVAALTDENTPIQPEGTTQSLQEFDKVFVEIRSTDVAATLGDFNIDFAGTEFARLSRKLQGAKGTADYRLGFSDGSVTLSAAVPRGKFNTNQFQGLEGVQGPYRLTGKNNERTIIVIAGTERVYIDGEPQTRGETNDYTIDYSTGEITFMPRRLITSASRITIDFEYTDRQYGRTLLAAQTASDFFESKARFTFSYFREADDPDAPIDFAITDSARKVLEQAGADRFKAVLSGVTRVDSNGLYLLDSAVVMDTLRYFYRYAPGDPQAKYIVTFSNVGFGRGEYVRQSSGIFVWKGPGQGDYLPIRLLPLPQSSQLMDFNLQVSPISDLRISGEFANSVFDANRFSALDDDNKAGHALKFEAAYLPKDVKIGGRNIGSFDILLKERYVNNRFVPIDRTNDIEFTRKWGIDSLRQSDEEIQEASLRYSPISPISFGGGYGRIARGREQKSVRNEGSLSVKGEGLPTASYYIESIRSREEAADNASSWLRHKGFVEYQIWKLTPGFRYEGEDRKVRTISSSLFKPGSLRFNAFAPGIKLGDLWNMDFSTGFEWRTDHRFNNGSVVRESKSFTQMYGWKLTEWNALSSSIDITLREKKFSPTFQLLGNSNIKTVLVRNQTRFSPFNRGVDTDLFYEVLTERSSRLQRVFVRVTQGTGNYKYLGDLNGNGLADDDEFVLTRFDGDFIAVTMPTDDLIPVIDLKTSVRFRLTPARFIQEPSGILEESARIISTETYVRVEEKSSERDLKQIYLLRFSRFQKDATTISGSTIFTQDLNLFEDRPEFSSRLRFTQRRGLNKFSSAIERNYARERSVRLRWQLVKEIANQIDFVNRIDRVTSSEPSSRVRDILSNSLAYDLSYRPTQNVELGMKVEVAKSEDRIPAQEVDADLNTQSLRLVYAFQGAGQARAEFAREEVILGRSLTTFPFELTGGRVVGKTWIWRASFDYRVTQFIQATLNYDGRSEGGRSPIHTARAEVRAFF
ncbi:MAG: hypothetical protein HY708_02195 [Ignavibacteriae bacterium]|nr:hypothetical protein [Ignavibacteriota bacterium]